MTKKRLILMGSPEFAVPSFETIIKSELYEVPAIYCQPDKPKGRGLENSACPTKNLGSFLNVPILHPENLKDDSTFEEYKNLKPDLTLVIAYGKILPKRYLDIPSFSTINVHASLLPELRGAAPINWSIVRGFKETGLTIMKVSPKLDSGDILTQFKFNISDEDNAQTLTKKLSELSTKEILNIIKNIFENKYLPQKQDESKATYAPIMKKSDGRIDFDKSGKEIFNLIRGFNPWPSAYTTLEGKTFKIHSATLIPLDNKYLNNENGTLVDKKTGLVKLSDSLLKLINIQIEGKASMDYEKFNLGFRPKNETVILK